MGTDTQLNAGLVVTIEDITLAKVYAVAVFIIVSFFLVKKLFN